MLQIAKDLILNFALSAKYYRAMITIKLLSLGKIKSSHIAAIEDEYLKRIRPLAKFDSLELECDRTTKEESFAAQVIAYNRKAPSFLKSSYIFVLSEEGIHKKSTELATHIAKETTKGHSAFSFIIGSAYGIDEEIRRSANMILALSKLTFPHELARLILVEQIYRILSIKNNSPYHK